MSNEFTELSGFVQPYFIAKNQNQKNRQGTTFYRIKTWSCIVMYNPMQDFNCWTPLQKKTMIGFLGYN